MREVVVIAGSVAASVVVTLAVAVRVVGRPPGRLIRTNHRGLEVPAVLGIAIAVGSAVGVPLAAVLASVAEVGLLEESIAVGWAVLLMAAAGSWDDLRGDERPRGFKGHLRALRGRALTGGIVKVGAAVAAGAVAAGFLPPRGAPPLAHLVEVVALTGLSANLVNLLDRAPGRAGKVVVMLAVPLVLLGDLGWAAAAAPVFGALVAVLPMDLREKAMLGDAGANPLGAVIGVGLAASLGETGRLVAIAILLALNLASEKWSFSRAIDRVPPLRWLDGLGRKDEVAPK
ncbi:MAG: hypothetical protein KY391_02470 [Actinobacteria bacterium]|nr:hypothetical protein [Actinomycetota bacterium]